MRYYRHAQWSHVLKWALLLTLRLLKQGYVAHRLKSSLHILRSSSQSGRPLQNCHISNGNWSFTFCVYIFFPLSFPRLLPDLTVFMSSTDGVLQEAETAQLSQVTEFTLVYFCWVRTAHLFSFLCLVLLFTFWLPCCDLLYDDRWKRCYLDLYPQLLVEGAHVLFTLFLFACS